MSILQNGLIRFTGHKASPSMIEHDRNSLALAGLTVLFAAIVVGVNWAIAGWVFSATLTDGWRIAATAAAAAVGLAITLVIDRAAVYFADTALNARKSTLALYLAFRVMIILLVSSVTAQAVMPVLLKNELTVHSLKMQERSDAQRGQTLDGRFGLTAKQGDVARARDDVTAAQAEVVRVAAEVKALKADAGRCWGDVSTRRRTLINQGLEISEAESRVAGLRANCKAKAKAAKAKEAGDLLRTRELLAEAQAAAGTASTSFNNANKAASDNRDAAGVIEKSAMNARSADVLRSLISENDGAFYKWLGVTLLLITLELLPLILKAMAGNSAHGMGLAVERVMAKLQVKRKQEVAERDDEVAMALAEINTNTLQSLGSSVEAQRIIREELLRRTQMQGYFETYDYVLRAVEERAKAHASSLTSNPGHKEVIANAWSSCLDLVAAELKQQATLAAKTGAAF